MKIYHIFEKGKNLIFSICSAYEILESEKIQKELYKT
jgi:hypothetical protein